MNIAIKIVILFVLTFSLLLAGCSSGQLAEATVTSTPTATSTSTFTPSATATQTLTPTMTPVPTEDFSVSLERAKQIVPETVIINGDYGYNTKGGVCNIFDEEKQDWIGIPFGEDFSDIPIQYVPGTGEISMAMIVNEVHRYGTPGNGAKEVKDASGKLLYHVALSVDAMNKVTDSSSPMFDEWQVAEIPIVIFRSDGLIFSDGTISYKNPPERPYTLDEIERNLAFYMYMWVPNEEKILYATPDENKRYTEVDITLSTIPIVDRGDVISADFFKDGVEPKSDLSKRIRDWMGLDPAIANQTDLTEFLQDGELSHLLINDTDIVKLYPSKVVIIRERLNQ